MSAAQVNKTRIAPTPSGLIHLGNAYSFLLTAKLAKEMNAKIILRIDDLDEARVRSSYINDIFESLEFLEIETDEGPKNYEEFCQTYSQHLRLPIYLSVLDQLVSTGKVFACNCSRTLILLTECLCQKKGIDLSDKDVSWRLDTSDCDAISFYEYGSAKAAWQLPREMKDFIIRKKDGRPSYQLTSLVDDVAWQVNLIVRGKDLFSSTLAQLYLAKLLGYDNFINTTFCHHALKNDQGGRKLSKSNGASSLKAFRESGRTLAQIKAMIF